MPLPSRLTRTVPVSIAAHLVVLILMLVIPLTANVVLPSLQTNALQEYIQAVPVPPPPPPPPGTRPRVPSTTRSATSTAAPVQAPSRIEAEPPLPPAGPPVDVGAIVLEGPDLGSMLTSAVPGPTLVTPPPPQKLAGPVRVTELVVAPRKVVDARPIYPEIARAARVQGTVILEAVIDPVGRIQQVRVLKSIPLLDQAAIDAVRQWQYTPSRLRGQPVSVLVTVTVTFTLS